MRYSLLSLLVLASVASLAAAEMAVESAAAKKPAKGAPLPPRAGIKTPGVQIPYSSLKSDTELDLGAKPGAGLTGATLWVPLRDKGTLARIDAKAAKLGDPISGLNKPCAGAVEAFGSLWVPDCGANTIARLDAKTGKLTATVESGTGDVTLGIAATADSIWAFTDTRTTLSRIDPKTNRVVAELRLPERCDALLSAESSLWCACPNIGPNIGKVLRIDPQTNLVTKRIETQALPIALAYGEGSLWAYCKKDGKLDRIDPKTDKVTKTIDIGTPGADGDLSVGEGAVWLSLTGFPVTRVDAKSERVLQQFWGPGGGLIRASGGAVWLYNTAQTSVTKLDPKRIQATLAE